MKIIVDRPKFAAALDRLAPVVKTRTPKPVYTCIKIDAPKGDAIELVGTNGDVTMHVKGEWTSVEASGVALIPFEKLRQIAKLDQSPTLTLETNAEHAMVIRTATSTFKIYGYDPKEFPVAEWSPPEWQTTMDSCELALQLCRIYSVISLEPHRYAITGALIGLNKKNVWAVSTDGRRIAVAGAAKEGAGNSAIVPRETVKLIINNSEEKQKAKLAFSDRAVFVDIGEGAIRIEGSLAEGTFPPFLDVIPRDHKIRFTVKAGALRQSLRAASLLTNEDSKSVCFTLNGEQAIVLSSRAPEQGEASVECDVEDRKGDNIEIGFNPTLMLGTFDAFDDDAVVSVELTEPSRPGVLKIGSDYKAAIMPVNLQ